MAPRLKKALGQHHLVDGQLCRPLVDFLAPAGRRVIEIGPGGGVLTDELLAAGAKVVAWEVDPEWAFTLASRPSHEGGHGGPPLRRDSAFTHLPVSRPTSVSAEPNLHLVVGDALDIPWERLPLGTLAAGNLPYNVGTVILRDLLSRGLGVERAAFLVQKEVADRLVAQPGDSAYGALSVLVAARTTAAFLGRVRAGSFRPPPKVDGGLVGLIRHPPPLPESQMANFEATVFAAFAKRRKTLRNSLGATWGRDVAEARLRAAGIAPDQRAERLGVAEFAALSFCTLTLPFLR
ncbi:MAG: 16S rRNA (adenine(1518)-N(6)/adenine(1519)-N(6))-dimethyltransferase RsmA [Thermoanaerobaculia bacterium]|nr:16S rRNA (adenine(1518)-N(6)/adenine(1519)-N(6))-dimethyltransferase RsmA [Thermoanaerobaculia bacterium]